MAPGDTQGAQNCELATILLGTLEVLIEVSVWELEEATTEAAIDGSMFSLQTLMAMHHRLGAILRDHEKKPGAKKPGAKKGDGGKRQKAAAPAEEAATQHDGRPGPSATQREPAGGASTSGSGSSSRVRAPLLTARCLARLLHAVVMLRPSRSPPCCRHFVCAWVALTLTPPYPGLDADWEGATCIVQVGGEVQRPSRHAAEPAQPIHPTLATFAADNALQQFALHNCVQLLKAATCPTERAWFVPHCSPSHSYSRSRRPEGCARAAVYAGCAR